MIVRAGTFQGVVELTCRNGRLAVEWHSKHAITEIVKPATEPACHRIPLRRRDGTIVAHTIVDPRDAHLDGFNWCMNRGGYAVRGENGRPVFMHRYILGAPAGLKVDHINRDRLDNRRCNLRLTDSAGNARNCGKNSQSGQPYKGIRRYGTRWGARLKYEGKWCCLGWLATPEEAAVAYDLMAMALFGEFAATNFQYQENHNSEELVQRLVWEAAQVLRAN